jgi:hypothetical protein
MIMRQEFSEFTAKNEENILKQALATMKLANATLSIILIAQHIVLLSVDDENKSKHLDDFRKLVRSTEEYIDAAFDGAREIMDAVGHKFVAEDEGTEGQDGA